MGVGQLMAESMFMSAGRRAEIVGDSTDPLAAAVLDIQTRSVAAYLRRQQLEAQRQQLQQATMLCEQELIALDGELRAVTALQQKAG